MSDGLQEIINNPEWYKNLRYKDVKVFIKDNINSASRSFVAIGYYLKYVRDNQLFTEDGYQNIWEFAQSEFGISKSQASKFMAINDKFSKDGNSPILLDKYKDFSSSKLSEMLYLTDEQLEHVTPATTVVEIREIKSPEKVVSTSKQETDQKSPYGLSKSVYPPDSLLTTKGCGNKYDCYSCARICKIRQENRYCVEAPIGHPFPCTTMNMLDMIEDEVGGECMFINLELAYHRAGDNEPVPCCKGCKTKNLCGYACNKARNRIEDIQPKIVDNEPEIVNDVDNNDLVETMEADIIQTVPEEPKQIQPELPILKNNDQRATFIDAYTTWPIWIDIKETGERYYRYDFDNGVSFVIRVSLRHKFIGWDKGGYSKTETEYGREEYFILGTQGSKYEPKEKTFTESGASRSMMIEYLKDFQRKGA